MKLFTHIISLGFSWTDIQMSTVVQCFLITFQITLLEIQVLIKLEKLELNIYFLGQYVEETDGQLLDINCTLQVKKHNLSTRRDIWSTSIKNWWIQTTPLEYYFSIPWLWIEIRPLNYEFFHGFFRQKHLHVKLLSAPRIPTSYF